MNNLKMKVSFKNFERIESKYSQSYQDLFVLTVLDGKENGTYLELGCGGPKYLNNTFILEDKFNWKGLSYDLDQRSVEEFNQVRSNKAFVKNCLELDFDEIIKELGSEIDYLSLDLEPAEVTLECLKAIPLDKINFKVVTFEHDKYRFGDIIQKESQQIFKEHGYTLVAENVGDPITNPFEDWYVKNVDVERILSLFCRSSESKDILFT
jgi:hypothetical protein